MISRKHSAPRRLAAFVAAGAAMCAAGSASAQTACASLPNPLYGLGGSAQKPLIGRVAAQIASTMTVVYAAPGACNGINALIGPTTATGNASYWTADGIEHTCTLPVTGQAIDFANMATGPTQCPGVDTLPPDIGDFTGPVSAFNFIVPTASTEQSISAEAAYIVYGFGAQSQLAPWTNESVLIRRDQNSAATIAIALSIGLPPNRFLGVDALTNGNSVTLVAGASGTNANAALGYVSAENADANRATVRTLAYQHFGQTCGYWPDSSATSFDKRNVRSGQYWIWAPTHFYAYVDGTGEITNARARDFIGYFTDAVNAPTGVNMLDIEIRNGNIPRCAMNVWRTSDLGPLMSYQPAEPCGCYFEQVATGATTCTACTTNAECPSSASVCRHNFCEVQ